MDEKSTKCETGACSSAVKLLQDEQTAVRSMFSAYEKADDHKNKEDIVGEISVALTSYSALENEIVYPALKETESCSTEPCSGSESHHQAKLILDQLQRLTADIDAPAYDKAVKDLKEIVLKHFADEEKSLFPAIDKCSEKADELNQKLKAFKADRSLSPSVESLLSK